MIQLNTRKAFASVLTALACVISGWPVQGYCLDDEVEITAPKGETASGQEGRDAVLRVARDSREGRESSPEDITLSLQYGRAWFPGEDSQR